MPPMTCALVERLQTIPDPRRQCENLKHPLVDIIILGFCGVWGAVTILWRLANGRR